MIVSCMKTKENVCIKIGKLIQLALINSAPFLSLRFKSLIAKPSLQEIFSEMISNLSAEIPELLSSSFQLEIMGKHHTFNTSHGSLHVT